MNLSWKRTLRTASSERFLAQREGKDVAAVDLFANLPAVGQSIRADRSVLAFPLCLDHGNLNYTVVIGEVLGNYEAAQNGQRIPDIYHP